MYTVLVAEPARLDIQDQQNWWAEHRSADQAARWYAGFFQALLQLETNPELFRRAPEDGLWPFTVRQLNYGLGRRATHRALFVVRKNEVVVLRVRHLAQDALTSDDV